jgi:hypothetical protein
MKKLHLKAKRKPMIKSLSNCTFPRCTQTDSKRFSRRARFRFRKVFAAKSRQIFVVGPTCSGAVFVCVSFAGGRGKPGLGEDRPGNFCPSFPRSGVNRLAT